MAFEQRFGRGTNDAGGVVTAVNLTQNQRPFDQRRILIGERFGIGRSRRLGEVAESVALFPLVLGSHRVHWIMRIGELGRGVNELAAIEIRRVEPLIQDIEHGQQ